MVWEAGNRRGGSFKFEENVVVVTIQTQMQGVAFCGSFNAEEHFKLSLLEISRQFANALLAYTHCGEC